MPMTSPVQILAQIDAAMRDAGLSHNHVEKDALALYCSFLSELMHDCAVTSDFDPDGMIQDFEQWFREARQTSSKVRHMLQNNLNESIVLAEAHGTLTDIRRKELVNFHMKILEALDQANRASREAF